MSTPGNSPSGPQPRGGPPDAAASAAPAAQQRTGPERPGASIDRYKLLEEIGRGGFGTVWLAEQREPVRRKVALKIIKLGMDTQQVIARFEAERQALAMMDHPNIARVLDAGATETGRPYFVMELVPGQAITHFCDKNYHTVPERLNLFIDVCHAVQHAHTKGIIHRDIKPSNVLVAYQDGGPAPKVIDFGIAKATDLELTDKTLLTEHRQMLGTPAYMSPEQAAHSGQGVDTRTDVYSLGVLLYELLTGTTPFDKTRLVKAGYAGMQKIICEEEPHKPSTRISARPGAVADNAHETVIQGAQTRESVDFVDTNPPAAPVRSQPADGPGTTSVAEISRHRRTDASALRKRLRGDLDWIVMKCLDKDRTRRYETASALALDIERHLKNEPVVAGPPSAAYKLWKFARRHRAGVAAGALVALSLVGGLIGAGVAFVRARAAESRALRQAYRASMSAASDALEHDRIETVRQYLFDAPAALRGWEWRHLSSRLEQNQRVHEGRGTFLNHLFAAPDGRSYYTLHGDPALGLRQWDRQTGELITALPTGLSCGRAWLAGGAPIRAFAHGENNRSVLEVLLLDPKTGGKQSEFRVEDRTNLTAEDVSDDGRLLCWAEGNSIVLIDRRNGSRRTMGPFSEGINFVRLWPQGRRLAAGAVNGPVRLIDTDSLTVLGKLDGHENMITYLEFSPDGKRLASASFDNTIRIWRTDGEPAPIAVLRGHAGPVFLVHYSPDGRLLASTGRDEVVRLWGAESGELRGVLPGQSSSLSALAFFPDGQTLSTADLEGKVRFWEIAIGEAGVFRGHASFVYPVLLAPDGATVISGAWDGFVGKPGCLRFWDAASGTPIASTGADNLFITAAALSPDGTRLVVAFNSFRGEPVRQIDIMDAATAGVLATISTKDHVDSISFDPSGQFFVWSNRAGDVTVADAQRGATLRKRTFIPRESPPIAVWSPNGKYIALGGVQSDAPGQPLELHLCDASSLETIRKWPLPFTNSIAFSPDSRRIATAGSDGVVRIRDIETGQELAALTGHGKDTLRATFSPDGRRLATGGRDNNIRLWDAQTYDQVGRLGGHTDYVYSLLWSADSERLLSSSGDGTVRIWETTPPTNRLEARRHWEQLREQVEPMVQRQFDELRDAAEVVAAVKADKSLSQRARQIALQLVLRESLKQQDRLSQK